MSGAIGHEISYLKGLKVDVSQLEEWKPSPEQALASFRLWFLPASGEGD
jgi:hypothetical protein